MKAIEEILRKTKYDGATGVISVYVSDLESIHEEFEQLQKENEELKEENNHMAIDCQMMMEDRVSDWVDDLIEENNQLFTNHEHE